MTSPPTTRAGSTSGSTTTPPSSRSHSIRSWWQHLGQSATRTRTSCTITADCGGSNGNRTRLWKVELQKLADETGLQIAVCHFPPGTTKWNQIEHRLFSFITMNWRGKPLVSLETIINLIGATTTSTGLEVYARLDDGTYPDKIKVPDTDFKAVNLHGDTFHPRMELQHQTQRLSIYALSTGPVVASLSD